MKKYSFKINNNTKKNNVKTIKTTANSFSSLLDSIISANVIKNNPYLTGIIDNSDYTEDTGKTLFIKTNQNTKSCNYDYDEFLTAMNYLAGLNNFKDTYDYELIDGTPVKFFNDEIQIGFDLIPIKYGYTHKMFENLKPKAKKTIIDIYIKLNK